MIENVVDKCVRVRISTVWSNVVRFTFLALATLAVAFPLYWVAATSLKTHAEAMSVPPTWFPEIPTFRNYLLQLNLGDRSEGAEYGGGGISPLPRYTLNGVIVSSSVTVAVIVIALMAGYGFSRFAIPGREAALMFFLASQMFPFIALIVSIYIMYRNLGLLNTYVGIIVAISGILLPFSVWIMKGFCDSIDRKGVRGGGTHRGRRKAPHPVHHHCSGAQARDHFGRNVLFPGSLESLVFRSHNRQGRSGPNGTVGAPDADG